MTQTDYYSLLGIQPDSSVEEIKKAYRKMARLYHPDMNPAPGAKDIFISITEAYEFLITNHNKVSNDHQSYQEAMEDWRKYRQHKSHRRAAAYARSSYSTFENTKFYKSTRILDGTSLIISTVISVLVIVFTIIGYTFRLHHPIPGLEKPSFFSFLMLLLLGLIFFVVSFIFLKVFLDSPKKNKK